jgi:hypothetical protein
MAEMGLVYQELLAVLFAPYTTAERDALENVPEGLVIRNTDTKHLNIYLEGEWHSIFDGYLEVYLKDDPYFYLGVTVTGHPECVLDDGDYIWYNRTSDILNVVISSTKLALSATNLGLASGVSLTLTGGFVALAEITKPATPTANIARFYAKDVGGDTHPHWLDDDGLETDMLAFVPKSLFDANTILAATTDDTPAALTVGEQKVVGRVTGGNIAALSLNAASGICQLDANGRVDPTQNTAKQFTIVIENPTASEDIGVPRFDIAVTIVKVVGVLTGDYTSVTIDPKHHTDRSNAGTALLSSPTAITSTTTGTSITSFGDATLAAGEFLWIETTAKTGTAGNLELHFYYTED